jgi:hypothetical protein
MKIVNYLALFSASLLVLGMVAYFQRSPGYMDADYYFAGSTRLMQGHGFSEVILWNYLDNPAGLPHPSHAYWMPLASLIGAVPLVLLPTSNFSGAQVIFALLAAFISPCVAAWSYRIYRRKEYALLAGALAIFPGFYLPYMGVSDTFGICMLLGLAWFSLVNRLDCPRESQPNPGKKYLLYFCLGVVAGLLHLGRAEGLLWLLLSFLVVIFINMKRSERVLQIESYLNISAVGAGYLIIMGAWLVRNLRVFGAIFTPGTSHSLWLTNYNELFAYPASYLNFNHWWASGLDAIVKDRLWAFGQNLQSTLAVQGEVILLPLALIGMWLNRDRIFYRIAVIAWFCILLLFTLVFPFQGARGGFFHAGAVLQTTIWLAVPVGFNRLIYWGKRVRGWNPVNASAVFGVSLVGLLLLISGLAVSKRVIGRDVNAPVWNEPAREYQYVVEYLKANGTMSDEVIMVNNPPGFYLAGGFPAIVVPDEPLSGLLSAAHRYHAEILLLDSNLPQPLRDVYARPQNQAGLSYITRIGDLIVFRIP